MTEATEKPTKQLRLTTAQANLLSELLEGPQTIVCAYQPGSALIRMGLATGQDDEWGHSRLLTITAAGRAHPAVATA